MSEDVVWTLLDAGDYPAARALLRRRLGGDETEHWLLTRIGTTYYEERRYAEALEYGEQALAIAPRCPLVVWDVAGTLQMLGRHEDALRYYRRLIARGPDAIAHGECGEGLAWARGVVADSYYRSALSLSSLGRFVAARNALDRHLAQRGPGCHSIYAIEVVRTRWAALAAS